MITKIDEFKKYLDTQSLNENNQIEYYKELIKADKIRLKNATGGEAEHILQNLAYNQKMLNKTKRELKKNPPQPEKETKVEPETYKKGDKVSVYDDGYFRQAKVLQCYDDTDYKNPVPIDIAIQGQDHKIKVKVTNTGEVRDFYVDAINAPSWKRTVYSEKK